MKRIVWKDRNNVLHIETPLGIVNIRVGLRDSIGREVDSIEILENNSAPERRSVRRGSINVRLVQLKGKA